ncbi:MFS transporter [Brucella intermedia]|uniref:MFS transporter n=1 Tax=Brucella intermedia TaxID=94625 RepID=UPI002362EDF1|nr:MFS transporter [Brucella intermedia]
MSPHSPLRNSHIRQLWTGLLLSAFGDEIYKIALVWTVVSVVSTSAGWFSAAQAGSVLLFSLFGGVLADRWNHRRTMIAMDLLRAVLVVLPPVLATFLNLSIWVLLPVAALVSGLKAFFDPALQAYLPMLAEQKQILQRTNGLFDSTRRLARIVGPSLAAPLQLLVQPLQFFTINAMTFVVSALMIACLPQCHTEAMAASESVFQRVVYGVRALRGQAIMQYLLLGHGIVNGAWQLGLVLSTALIIQSQHEGSVALYGLIMSSYGIGNVVANIWVSRLCIGNPIVPVVGGRLIASAGFIALGLAPTPALMMAAAAFAAVGAPLSNIPFLNLLQQRFSRADIARVYRLRMVSEGGFILIAMAISPSLFKLMAPDMVVVGSGLTIGLVGTYGWLRFGVGKSRLEFEK